MKDRYKTPCRYRLTNPPKALFNARRDNIAIVPASMLPLTETLKEKVHTLPKGAVMLCYAAENTRQRKLLERVGETFRQHGHAVMHLSMEQVVYPSDHSCHSTDVERVADLVFYDVSRCSDFAGTRASSSCITREKASKPDAPGSQKS